MPTEWVHRLQLRNASALAVAASSTVTPSALARGMREAARPPTSCYKTWRDLDLNPPARPLLSKTEPPSAFALKKV